LRYDIYMSLGFKRLMFSSYPGLGFSSSLFLQVFISKIRVPVLSKLHVTFSSHLVLLGFIIRLVIWRHVKSQDSSTLCNFLALYYFSPSQSIIFLSVPFSRTPTTYIHALHVCRWQTRRRTILDLTFVGVSCINRLVMSSYIQF